MRLRVLSYNIHKCIGGADRRYDPTRIGEVIRALEPEGDSRRVAVAAPPGVLRYCVEKGSLAVDGVSLTIAALDDRGVGIALVPHTLRETTLSALESGAAVNLEADVLAKYVERLAQP